MGAALPAGACAARMLLFVGGPSTEGSGKVVDRELSENIRSHEVGTAYPLTAKVCLFVQLWYESCMVNSKSRLFGDSSIEDLHEQSLAAF